MPKVIYVEKARQDNPVAKKGEPYYWWKFRHGGKHFSATYPKRSQLTQSEYLGAIYALIEAHTPLDSDAFSVDGHGESWASEIAEELNNLADEQRDKQGNLPEGLQEGPTGQLLDERAQACEDAAGEFEGADWPSYEDVKEELEREEDETEEEFEARVQEEFQNRCVEVADECMGHLENCVI